MNRKRLLLGTGCLLSLVTFTTVALTQDERPGRRPPTTDLKQPETFELNPPAKYDLPGPQNVPVYGPDGTPLIYRRKTVPRTVYATVAVRVSPEETKELQAMEAAKVNLKKAQDDVARKAATEVIQKYLVKQFELDLAQREKELTAVEERLKTLRQQLDKRKQTKDEIITLRLKTIVNNAEGLGFPGDEDPRSVGDDDTSLYFDPPTYRAPNREVFQPVPDDEFDAPLPRRTPLQQPDGPPVVKPRKF